MRKLKIAVLVDRDRASRFGIKALDALAGCDEISVFSCLNTRIRRRAFRHAAYYALNLLSVRNRLTSYVPVSMCRKPIAETVEFESGYEGAWQTLPPEIVEKLGAFDVVVKLGLGLLRVPPADRLPTPILSWHHGDPDRYRGRPAGFWEMVDGAPLMGQIVQILSNKLDSGSVVAFAETRVHPHSYRATLIEAYGVSPLLLNEAVRNALAGRTLEKSASGRNCRLPSNLAVLRFAAKMALGFAKRLAYGAFFEKGWCVSEAPLASDEVATVAEGRHFPPPESWRTLPTPPGYTFLADPFPSREPPGILVEALSRRTALGEILLVGEQGAKPLVSGRSHFSYPATFKAGMEMFIVPEMEQAGRQRRFRLSGGAAEDAGPLEIDGASRIIDPTLVEHEGRVYLLGNDAALGSTALFLWSAASMDAPFVRHPLSPILISPRGGRMAGAVADIDGRLIRFGQSFVGDYGEGVFAFEIERMTAEDYCERRIGEIRFGDRQGPHTINFDDGRVVFDWYHKRFSALAGARRLKSWLGANRLRDSGN
jgi:hypothetical protein